MKVMQEEDTQAVPMKSKGRRGPSGSGKFSTPFTTGATKALHACADKRGGHEEHQARLTVSSVSSACLVAALSIGMGFENL